MCQFAVPTILLEPAVSILTNALFALGGLFAGSLFVWLCCPPQTARLVAKRAAEQQLAGERRFTGGGSRIATCMTSLRRYGGIDVAAWGVT